MAELPDLGKFCSLQSCNKLDYTPFFCRTCSQYYCSDHRFLHGCDASRTFDPAASSSSAPLKPFLCSKEGCSTGESIKITCPFCEFNFCLEHRLPPDHFCQQVDKKDEKDPEIVERVRKMHEMLDPIVRAEKAAQEGHLESIVKEPLSAAEQARLERISAMRSKLKGNVPVSEEEPVRKVEIQIPAAKLQETGMKTTAELSAQQQREDRMAVMKLKMSVKPVAGVEMQILFVEWPGGRKPIFVHKTWTVGKAVSVAKEQLKIEIEVKSLAKRASEQVVDLADIISQVLKDEDTIILN